MTRYLPIFVVAVAMIATVSGCASMSSVEAPDVTLVDLQVGDITVFETSLTATVRITNPNPDPLDIDGASFKLELDGRKIGTGTSSDALIVPRLDSATIEVNFHLNNIAAVTRLRSMLDHEVVDWGLRGKVFVRGAYGTRSLRVEHAGRIDLDAPTLPQLPGSNEP